MPAGWERGAARRGGASERGAGAGRRRHGSRPAHLGVGLQRAHLAHARPASARRTEIGRHRVVCSGHLGFKKKKAQSPKLPGGEAVDCRPCSASLRHDADACGPCGASTKRTAAHSPPCPASTPPLSPLHVTHCAMQFAQNASSRSWSRATC